MLSCDVGMADVVFGWLPRYMACDMSNRKKRWYRQAARKVSCDEQTGRAGEGVWKRKIFAGQYERRRRMNRLGH